MQHDMLAAISHLRERLAVAETRIYHIETVLEHMRTRNHSIDERLNLAMTNVGRMQDAIANHQRWHSDQMRRISQDMSKLSQSKTAMKETLPSLGVALEILKWGSAAVIIALVIFGKISPEQAKHLIGAG